MKRPLKNRRVLGPFISTSDSGDSVELEGDGDVGHDAESTEYEDPILEQAENWFESISKESNKRKMMKNYFKSMTNLSDAEIEQKMDEAGL